VYEETLTGRPHDTSVQKATSDNENKDAVQRHAQDVCLGVRRVSSYFSYLPSHFSSMEQMLMLMLKIDSTKVNELTSLTSPIAC